MKGILGCINFGESGVKSLTRCIHNGISNGYIVLRCNDERKGNSGLCEIYQIVKGIN